MATALNLDWAASGAASGQPFDYLPVVSGRTAGVVDGSYVGVVTAAITTGAGVLIGTVTKTCVAGIADFSQTGLGITGTGANIITYSASGLTSVVNPSITPVTPVFDAIPLADGFSIELPRVTVDSSYPTLTGTIYTETQSTLQSRLNTLAAVTNRTLNDEIRIADSTSVTINASMPVRDAGSTGWITVRATTLPCSPGTRMTPTLAAAANVAKVVSDIDSPVFTTPVGAHHYRLTGLEITQGATTTMDHFLGFGEGDGTYTSLATIPHHLVIDRMYIHGQDAKWCKRGVSFNCATGAIVDSYISGVHDNNPTFYTDPDAVGSWQSSGPLKFDNTYLEGSAESLAFGGVDTPIPWLLARDVYITHCVFSRPAAWVGQTGHGNKNALESKSSQRVVVSGCVFENTWENLQDGSFCLLSSTDQNGNAPWSHTADWSFHDNLARNVGSGFSICGNPNPGNTYLPLQNVAVYNNITAGIGEGVFTSSIPKDFFILCEGPDGNGVVQNIKGLYTRHNTFASKTQLGASVQISTNPPYPMSHFYAVDTLFRSSTYLIYCNTGTLGQAGIALTTTGTVSVTKNVWVDPTNFAGSVTMPAGNFFPSANTGVGYTTVTVLNDTITPTPEAIVAALALTAGSAYHNAALDGTDIGANTATVLTAITGVYAGVPGNAPPPPPTSTSWLHLRRHRNNGERA